MEEKLVEMSSDERRLLESSKSSVKGIGCALPLAIVFGIFFAFLYYRLPMSYWNSKVFLSIISVVFIIAVLIISLLYYMDRDTKKTELRRIDKDLEEGLKKIVPRKVQEQKISGGEVHTHRQKGPSTEVDNIL